MTTAAWHQLSTLRDDVRSGKLTLAEFAADLNDARTGAAPDVYRDPGMFFDRTYATHSMKNLGRDVLSRLAGGGGKPVLRLQVAYGGGKTHTLITLMHLAERGQALAEHRTVREFMNFAGLPALPKARVALLPGDKIDVIEGLEVRGPTGQTRRVRTLWGALAYQLAGDVGYARLKSHDEAFTVPAEPLLVDLLRTPQAEGLGTLVLVDEAVLYYRSLVNSNPRMLGTIKDFYQLLTQATAKAERAVLVASLMASQIEANDPTGVQCLSALEEVFERIAEPLEPVTRDDVAEILRRRLFDHVPGPEERRPAVDAQMASLNRLPVQESQRDQAAYDRLLESYPFHPDLISVLYQKWTQLSKFQRTRGALRLLAYALRESEGKDISPFIGVNALLPYHESTKRGSLSPALNELTDVCEEGHRWTSSLTGELEKAREIQLTLPTLAQRELEASVIGTFLHSQPSGARASNAELVGMLAQPETDPSALSEGLRKWRERSWFLVENPDVWQLGIVPNLNHMHFQAKNRLLETDVEDELRKRIQGVPSLRLVDEGVVVHMLPKSPADIDDNLELHYLVLQPDCAVTLGRPLPEAVESYFNDKKNRRVYRNNLLALTPESASVAGLREQVRNFLAWKKLEDPENYKLLTDYQKQQLPGKKQEATNNLPESVVGAYRILVAVDEDGTIKAQSLPSGTTPFARIKEALTSEERLVTALDPDLILPGSYFELWRDDQTSMRVTDLVAAFGQFTRLPRLLRPQSLYETIKDGIREGTIVLRLPRTDGSVRTWWRTEPDDDTLRRPEVEIQATGQALLHNLDGEMLKPDRIPGLWPGEGQKSVSIGGLRAFFDGTQAPRLVGPEILETAVQQAVKRGDVMADNGTVGYYREDLPAGPLAGSLLLLAPPAKISGVQLTAQSLPAAWQEGRATLAALLDELASQQSYSLPWTVVQTAVDEALGMKLFEVAQGDWPCSPAAAQELLFRRVEKIEITPQMVVSAIEYTDSQTPTLRAIKEVIEKKFFGGRTVPDESFFRTAKTMTQDGVLATVTPWNDQTPNNVRVRRPDQTLFAEAALSQFELSRLAESVGELLEAAPELNFGFRVSLIAEGQVKESALVERLNEILAKIHKGWALQ